MFYLRYADSGASLCMGTVTGRVAGLAAPLTGAYANTMPAAVPADYDDGLVEKCTELFVTKNLEGQRQINAETSARSAGVSA